MSVGQGASLNGFVPFPSDNFWNKDISSATVDPNSASIIGYIGSTIGIHPDFGSGLYNSSYMGIPYTIVEGTQPLIPINYTAYGSESDAGPMPIPLTAPIRATSASVSPPPSPPTPFTPPTPTAKPPPPPPSPSTNLWSAAGFTAGSPARRVALPLRSFVCRVRLFALRDAAGYFVVVAAGL
jgi:hypothetical protein